MIVETTVMEETDHTSLATAHPLVCKGAIEEDDIGHAMVHGDADQGAAEPHGYGKDGIPGEGIDKNGQHGSGHGRNKGQDSQPGPSKTQERQGDQPDRDQGEGPGGVPLDDSLVVQGGPESAGIDHRERSRLPKQGTGSSFEEISSSVSVSRWAKRASWEN